MGAAAMMRAAFVGAVLLAGAALAAAQEPTIGFEDASLDVMPPAYSAIADLVSGTIAVAEDRLEVTIELASLPEMTPGMAYIMIFSNGTADWWAGVFTTPSPTFAYGVWDDATTSPVSADDTHGSYVAGTPGSVLADFAYSALGTDVVTRPRGMALDIKGGAPTIVAPFAAPFVVVDEAEGAGELVLPAGENATVEGSSAPPGSPAVASPTAASTSAPSRAAGSATPADPVPGFGASIALAALAGALLGARQRSR